MTNADSDLIRLFTAIADGDVASTARLLDTTPGLATRPAEVGATRANATECYFERIGHYVYRGDTALHVAGAAYQPGIARMVIEAGADVAARNRRGATALHYAADGNPNSSTWDPPAQAATISYLIAVGADPNAVDRSGVGPLHRAVRTRSAAAVAALLSGGADPGLANGNGSTPWDLATRTTGRGGSGSPKSRAQQQEILTLLAPDEPA